MGALASAELTVIVLKMKTHSNKSIEELENDYWDKPKFKSHLVTECHKLRKKPISALSIENLRILIGQNIGLKYIVPIAIEILEKNPFAEGNFYKGDLLFNITKISAEFWLENPKLNNRLVEIKNEISIINETIEMELVPALSSFNYK